MKIKEAHQNQNRIISIFLIVVLILTFVFSFTGCTKPTAEPTITSTPTPALSATPSPRWPGDHPEPTFTSTPTLPPMGQPGNPVTFGIVYRDKGRQQPAVQAFLQSLADETGWVTEVLEFDNTFDLLVAMDAGRVSFTWMLPLTYIYAQQNEIATIAFVSRSYNLTAYGSQFLARTESNYQSFFNEDQGISEVDETSALQQFSGTRPCFLDEKSLAGYVVPLGFLRLAGVDIEEPVFLLTSTGVIRGIRAGGICEFGATYAVMGDPRTSSELLEEYPDLLDEVNIIWRSEAIIPNLSLVFSTHLDGMTSNTLANAIEKISNQPEGPQNLSAATSFLIEGLERASDDLYESLRTVVTASGIDLVEYLGN